MKNNKGKFAPFWIMLGIFFILFIGALITPFKYVLDEVFKDMNSNSNVSLRCNNPDAVWYVRATCFVLQGFMIVFILYLLYSVIDFISKGVTTKTPVISQRYNQIRSLREHLET